MDLATAEQILSEHFGRTTISRGLAAAPAMVTGRWAASPNPPLLGDDEGRIAHSATSADQQRRLPVRLRAECAAAAGGS